MRNFAILSIKIIFLVFFAFLVIPCSSWARQAFFIVNNGYAGHTVEIEEGAKVEIKFILIPESNEEKRGLEVWIGVKTPFAPPNQWFFLNGESGWTRNLSTPIRLNLSGETSVNILDIPLPRGNYTLYVLIDQKPDGEITFSEDSLYSLTINILNSSETTPAPQSLRTKALDILREIESGVDTTLKNKIETYVNSYTDYSWKTGKNGNNQELSPPATPADLYRQLSILAIFRGAITDALWCALKGVDKDPHDPYVLLQAGVVLNGLGRYEEAREFLLAASALRHDDPAILQALAINEMGLKRYRDAINTLLGALEKEPWNTGAMAMLGKAYHEAGMDAMAKATLALAKRMNPGDGNVEATIKAYGWSTVVNGPPSCDAGLQESAPLSLEEIQKILDLIKNSNLNPENFGLSFEVGSAFQPTFEGIMACEDKALSETGTYLDDFVRGFNEIHEWFFQEEDDIGTYIYDTCYTECDSACWESTAACNLCTAKCDLRYCSQMNGLYESYITKWAQRVRPLLYGYPPKIKDFLTCAYTSLDQHLGELSVDEVTWLSQTVDNFGCTLFQGYEQIMELALDDLYTLGDEVDAICKDARASYEEAEQEVQREQEAVYQQLLQELYYQLEQEIERWQELAKRSVQEPFKVEIAIDQLFSIGADETGNIKFGVGIGIVGASFQVNTQSLGLTVEVGVGLADSTGGNFAAGAISLHGHIDRNGSDFGVVAGASGVVGTVGKSVTLIGFKRDFRTGQLTWGSDL